MGANINPVFGIGAIPLSGLLSRQHASMQIDEQEDEGDQSPRDVLAANLRTLMAAAGLINLDQLVTLSNGQVTRGTLDRIRRRESATGVDNLAPIARVFGLQPWQMLVPGIRARRSADGSLLVIGLPDWPLDMVDRSRFYSLREPERAYVQAKMMAAIEEREQSITKEDALADSTRLRAGRSKELNKRRKGTP